MHVYISQCPVTGRYSVMFSRRRGRGVTRAVCNVRTVTLDPHVKAAALRPAKKRRAT